jgi:hypothetical protein
MKNKSLSTQIFAGEALVAVQYHLQVEKYFPATAISGGAHKNHDSTRR